MWFWVPHWSLALLGKAARHNCPFCNTSNKYIIIYHVEKYHIEPDKNIYCNTVIMCFLILCIPVKCYEYTDREQCMCVKIKWKLGKESGLGKLLFELLEVGAVLQIIESIFTRWCWQALKIPASSSKETLHEIHV